MASEVSVDWKGDVMKGADMAGIAKGCEAGRRLPSRRSGTSDAVKSSSSRLACKGL